MKYKGIIFDFNGVLLWDSHLHEETYSKMAVKLRGTPMNNEEIENKMHGVPNKKIQEYILGREISVEESEKLTQEKEGMYRQLCLDNPEEFILSPGAIELLDFIKQNNIPHTIATSSEKTNVDFFINNLNLEKWFDLENIIFDDNSFPGKPAPDIYLKAAQKIGLKPQECVVVEDAKSGIASAHAAGIGMIFALGPVEKHDQLKKLEGVSAAIQSLKDFPKDAIFFY